MTTTATTSRPGLSNDVQSHTRTFLLADAALTGLNGLGYLALAGVLDDLFGVSAGLLITLGILLLVVGVEVSLLATRRPIPGPWVRVLGLFNLAWVAASVVFAIVADLTTAGLVWTLLQAAIVLAFAVRQLQLAPRL